MTISKIFPLIFSAIGWPQVTESRESKAEDKKAATLPLLNFSIC